MSKFTEKIPGISALMLVVISVVLVALIYIGGDEDVIEFSGDILTVPKFTDALLYWAYFLMIFAVCTTLFLALLNYIKNFRHNPKLALKSLIPVALFLLLFVVTWNIGNGYKLSIIGYEGTQNQGFWAQFTDMVIYASYTLFVAIIITIIGARIYVLKR
jgi:hypothetical protein